MSYLLQYHESWNWLMPVVEKINTITIDNYGEMNVMISAHECLIGEDYYHPIVDIKIEPEKSMKQMVYKAVVEFIKWYNEK